MLHNYNIRLKRILIFNYMCVCVCIVCTCMYVYAWMYVCVHVCMHVFTCVWYSGPGKGIRSYGAGCELPDMRAWN